MILRGAFCMGLVWLCMTQGPDLSHGLGQAPAAACQAADCQDPVGATSDALRQDTLARLQALKLELNTAMAARHGALAAASQKALS